MLRLRLRFRLRLHLHVRFRLRFTTKKYTTLGPKFYAKLVLAITRRKMNENRRFWANLHRILRRF